MAAKIRVYCADEDFFPDGKRKETEGRAPVRRFHNHRGENIDLSPDGSVAFRRSSFANGIVFSERGIEENEVFLIEILRNENGWSGHIRLGLTYVDPDLSPLLPLYALPDLNVSGQAWIFGLTDSNSTVYDGVNGQVVLSGGASNVVGLVSREGTGEDVDFSIFNPNIDVDRKRLPTDVGSRVGVCYRTLNRGRLAQIYFIINGYLRGPLADIPLIPGKSLYAIVDVYGTTKQIRIVPLRNQVDSLQVMCRSVILRSMKCPQLDSLPLPKPLLLFLRSGPQLRNNPTTSMYDNAD